MGLFVKKGDTVQVLSGKDRGVTGKVILTLPKDNRVLVEGVNRIKKHTRVQTTTRGAQYGGIVTQEAPIHASNVMVVCPGCGKPSRLGHRKDDEGPFRAHLQALRRRRSEDSDDYNQSRAGACRGCSSDTATRSWPALQEQFGYANVMQVPCVTKVKVNMGVGEAARDAKLIDGAVRDLTADHRSAPRGGSRTQVHRAVQAARGHADRRPRHAAR